MAVIHMPTPHTVLKIRYFIKFYRNTIQKERTRFLKKKVNRFSGGYGYPGYGYGYYSSFPYSRGEKSNDLEI